MSQIHFGYVLFDEGTDNESVRVLLAASLAGLEAQAYLLGLRLRMEDYVNEYYDLEAHDEESLYDAKHKNCSDSKCIVAGAEPCVEPIMKDRTGTSFDDDDSDYDYDYEGTDTEDEVVE
mgnify:CR=1 FL=1